MYCSSDQCVLKQMYSLKEIRPSQSCSIRKMFSLGYGANARNITICLIQPCLKLSERYRTRITQANFINDFQILSLLVVNISDSMLHPISFRFIPITTGVFIASKSSIVRVLTRATSRTSWTRCLTHLPHATPSEHLEQIVVARNASIYGVRNRTKDTVWLQSLLKTLFWCVGACELKVLCHPHKLYVQHWTLFPVISQHECCLLNVALLRDYMLANVRITREDVRALLLRYTS